MKNLKNFAFGLLVAVLAIGFSAFTPNKSLAEGDLYVWTGSQFDLIPSGEFDPENCNPATELSCGYRVTAAGAAHVSGNVLTEEQGKDFINESTPYMVPDPESSIGEYQQ